MLVSGAVHAEDLPHFDVEAYCKQVSSVGGSSNAIYNSCIDMQQDAYDVLKSSWADVPAKTQDYCQQVASVGGSSYSILKSCIEMETDAASNRKSFQFN
ncbi:hypothetical protein FY550_14620 [Kushneria phosphatilytica]|uniref:Uncharacterized protein n=2 Tax=Kushneria phosphatilytica TaxID=657387 RepID=A0A5C1A3T3_9GAMM|nr:hypothetical protein FY550_14620 [Kushneria phosphatilytica]